MFKDHLITHLKFYESLENQQHQQVNWVGENEAKFVEVQGRKGLNFDGSGYVQLQDNLLESVNDETGFTFSSWVYVKEGASAWERIFDFGSGEGKPSVFFTRNFRGTLSGFGDLVADGSKRYVENKWVYLTYVYTPTDKARNSSAGGRVYIDGELVGDGLINQTTSGLFGKLKLWTALFEEEGQYTQNYLGHSQYAADPDFRGVLSDVALYNKSLSESEILSLMAKSLDDQDIINIAKNRDLDLGLHVIHDDMHLPLSLFGDLVDVKYESSNTNALSHDGKVQTIDKPEHVTLKVTLSRNDVVDETTHSFTVLPKSLAAYKLKVKPDVKADVSEIMYGLFYEDINNAADGGIYAEMIRNRSFESFTFDDFQPNDNVCGCDVGRTHDPLQGWYGDLDKVEIKTQGGLNEHLDLDKGVNTHFVEVENATLINKGYNDQNHYCAMRFEENENYDFSVWLKGTGNLKVTLKDEHDASISESVVITNDSNVWQQHTSLVLKSNKTTLGQMTFEIEGKLSIDNFSMMPQNVWGNEKENISKTANMNYTINKNYRMRKDLVHALKDLNPKFLRFPGGCISEGAFVWDNVFDWKQTIGDVEERKENFNLWGYSMTMGLGYFEYFQLAEDLNAYPVPVMACGVLCQARSDYAAPAGGILRDYYISNFTDLIDFAISMDFENNVWAQKRKELGHEAPFDLKYLGVGNENWGDEFFANFEIFNYEIEKHMKTHYPDHELHIISTVGAQADDDAFQDGWKFLHGDHKGVDSLEFSDGMMLFNEDISWYEHHDHYMNTIADEHYYRTNDYLKNNVDRYNYYKRAYDAEGNIDVEHTSKVFVGEYASTDKNTLHGAISEAALMTGFENNADVVVMASYAPLFNKVLTDTTYRWTPDLIWFDNEEVWFTPNYHNQKLFGNNIGRHVLKTDFTTYHDGVETTRTPKGAISIASINSELLIKKVTIIDNKTREVRFAQDFSQALDASIKTYTHGLGYTQTNEGIILKAQDSGENGIVIDQDFEDYTLDLDVKRISSEGAILVGVGLTSLNPKTVHEYAIDYQGHTTGLRVFKDGIEGYRMGDFSTSVVAGNLRRSLHESLEDHENLNVSINFGREDLSAHYTVDKSDVKGQLVVKNEVYNKELFNTVSEDDEALYIKLVNIDPVDKCVSLDLTNWNLEDKATLSILTGDDEILDMSNVNEKNQERIQTITKEVHVVKGHIDLMCSKYSVNVLKVLKS